MRVLLVDDEAYDMEWIADLVSRSGHQLVVATNRADGERRLREHARGERFGLAIIDVMMATHGLSELREWNAQVAANSMRSGLDLIAFARRELGIPARDLPIFCYTARDDVEDEAVALGSEYFARDGSPAFRDRLKQFLGLEKTP